MRIVAVGVIELGHQFAVLLARVRHLVGQVGHAPLQLVHDLLVLERHLLTMLLTPVVHSSTPCAAQIAATVARHEHLLTATEAAIGRVAGCRRRRRRRREQRRRRRQHAHRRRAVAAGERARRRIQVVGYLLDGGGRGRADARERARAHLRRRRVHFARSLLLLLLVVDIVAVGLETVGQIERDVAVLASLIVDVLVVVVVVVIVILFICIVVIEDAIAVRAVLEGGRASTLLLLQLLLLMAVIAGEELDAGNELLVVDLAGVVRIEQAAQLLERVGHGVRPEHVVAHAVARERDKALRVYPARVLRVVQVEEAAVVDLVLAIAIATAAAAAADLVASRRRCHHHRHQTTTLMYVYICVMLTRPRSFPHSLASLKLICL